MGIWKDIEAMPDGLWSFVGERGNRLSGGQRQNLETSGPGHSGNSRTGSGGACCKKTPVVLLDEVASALDGESKSEIVHRIEKLKEKAAVLVVAQKLKTIEKADCIYVIKSGRIAEYGTHEELMARHGEYERLVGLERMQQ